MIEVQSVPEVVFILFRVLAAIFAAYIAHQKGRDWINWSILALFAPFIAIAGALFVEKRVQSIIVYPQMSVMENSVAFCEKAMQFLDNDQQKRRCISTLQIFLPER